MKLGAIANLKRRRHRPEVALFMPATARFRTTEFSAILHAFILIPKHQHQPLKNLQQNEGNQEVVLLAIAVEPFRTTPWMRIMPLVLLAGLEMLMVAEFLVSEDLSEILLSGKIIRGQQNGIMQKPRKVIHL
jgi:hypothetical protein